ncbi:SDR family NAD(P)-dependent oxidoreductase [Coraliomargarita akajimensis]|uniref:Short-chain dehydrogenase/reductase SDR n=1 Tax=Coraliomargarita akajimensis (strain DSM 45221 / IAM 15411 / JCM 23193 / KCTC 12865 / 04OKA010-24) TaxID=583355 RepID=D5EN00_CORAD|nr:SDR family oxidoreductase [Coraliomargarita akajimensis]ADE55390.1 short-chain dehydrogenase/reductase SDR [Coraliomargarita akajimensis DSM 45221]
MATDDSSLPSLLLLGATGGIGRHLCRRFADQDWDLYLSGRSQERLDALSSCTSNPTLLADLKDGAARKALIEQLPQLDGLVYAAGVAPVAPVRFLKADDLENCLQVNLQLPLLLIRDLLKAKRLKDGASVVLLSSVSAARGVAGYAAYAASKAALEAASRCLAVELSSKRIRVNCVAPGMVRGDMADQASDQFSSEALEAHWSKYPLGAGSPTSVVKAVEYLLSDAAEWTTGSVLTVDGGYSIS